MSSVCLSSVQGLKSNERFHNRHTDYSILGQGLELLQWSCCQVQISRDTLTTQSLAKIRAILELCIGWPSKRTIQTGTHTHLPPPIKTLLMKKHYKYQGNLFHLLFSICLFEEPKSMSSKTSQYIYPVVENNDHTFTM